MSAPQREIEKALDEYGNACVRRAVSANCGRSMGKAESVAARAEVLRLYAEASRAGVDYGAAMTAFHAVAVCSGTYPADWGEQKKAEEGAVRAIVDAALVGRGEKS